MSEPTVKHIAIVLTADPSGGGKFQYSLSILDAICLFDAQKYKISVVYEDDHWCEFIPKERCTVLKFRRSFLERVVRKGFLIIPFLGLKLWRNVGGFIFDLLRILRRIKPDIVLYPNNDSFVYESTLPGIIPIFDLMHIYHPEFPEVSAEGTAGKRELHYTRVCHYARAILVDSEVGRDHVIENYAIDEKKIYVLPYVAPPYVYEKNINTNVLLQYNLPDTFIFYPAQFWKHKNHIGLLRALSILKQRGREIHAVFVGSPKNAGEEVSELIKNLNLTNQVINLKYVSNHELVALYKKALALVMPTFLGPTNIPQLEAFALGCPVITSNIYGIPEQVGNAVLLIDPYDPEDIANKIEKLFDDGNLRQKLVNEGYKKDKEWNLDNFSHRIMSIISELM